MHVHSYLQPEERKLDKHTEVRGGAEVSEGPNLGLDEEPPCCWAPGDPALFRGRTEAGGPVFIPR